MSITSSNHEQANSSISDLLNRYPNLDLWLSSVLQREAEPRAEGLLRSFLAECTIQGVPSDSYPFSAEDQGLADLRIFLQQAQEEINAFLSSPTPRVVPRRASSSSQGARKKIGKISMSSATPKSANAPGAGDGAFAHDATIEEKQTDKRAAIKQPDAAPPMDEASQEGSEITASAVAPTSADFADLATIPALPADTTVFAEPEAAVEENAANVEETPAVAPTGAQGKARPPVRSKKARVRRPRTRRQRIISWVLLILILGAILVPVGFMVNFGISAYTTYHELSDQAHSAVNHLLNVKNIFSADKSHLSGVFDPAKLRQAEKEFVASGHDFRQLQNLMNHSSTLSTVTTYLPQYRATVKSAQTASVIGIDVATIGQIATSQAIQIAPSLSGPLLSTSTKPLVTQHMLDTIGVTLDQVMPLLNDIQANTHDLSLDSLPISSQQKSQVGQLLQLLPSIITDLGQVRSLLGVSGWLLGVAQPRTFLVQTMDRAELRGTGGFTGQYGELTINGGRVAPFSLKDISLVEYTNTSVTQGQLAPTQYRSWWPFANWGLRDSNISADFPTSAQMAINLYQQETGHQVDGVISFTPVVIEHVLAVTGPLQVPGYNTSVTAQNLEDLLHYYQLDNSGIFKQAIQQPGNTDTSTRKRFTNYLASLLMARVRAASPGELLSIAQQVFSDLKTKDLQIYFTDPASEKLLLDDGYAGQMDRSLTHDGLYVVQQNLSASKASQYVRTILHDTVTLDKKGGATHLLQLRLVYNQAGPVYGYDTYFDYLRVYVPLNSQLLWGDGFSTGTPLCGGSYGACVGDIYPDGELTCPAGQYQPGAAPPNLTGSDGATWQPLQTLGGPTNTTSDEQGRAMYGGWVIVPKNCTMNVTLSWYVPPLAQQPYTLLVQRQAGTFPELDLTILPTAADCAQLRISGLHFDRTLTRDTSFTPTPYNPTKQGAQGCYPQPSA